MEMDYKETTALIAVSGVFLGIGAIFFLIIAFDIIWRQGWKSMMWIMIPVYPINAAYLGPLALHLYFKYGRAKKPGVTAKIEDDEAKPMDHMDHHHNEDEKSDGSARHSGPQGHHTHDNMDEKTDEGSEMHMHDHSHRAATAEPPTHHDYMAMSNAEHAEHAEHQEAAHHDHVAVHAEHHGTAHQHHTMDDPSRPFYATVLIGVMHCGAGCILGDLVGEWLVYSTGAMIHNHDIWPSLLIDYAFALLIGIIFQYFSIAPMSGLYGPKTIVRAAKADFLSLTAFEVGLFGWMIAYQVGIWGYKLEMNTWTYWWMMQVGMFFGYWTSLPVNWWLLKTGIKEPCV